MREIALPVDWVQREMYQVEVRYLRDRYLLEKEYGRPLPALTVELVGTPKGKGKWGDPALAAVREHFRKDEYTVWVSGSEENLEDRFILMSYPGLRRKGHPAYKRMVEIFGEERLKNLNKAAEKAKANLSGNRGGGDPDLFVFKGDGKQERFFVEAKDKDPVSPKQRICFELIEKHLDCDVFVARLKYEGQPANPPR